MLVLYLSVHGGGGGGGDIVTLRIVTLRYTDSQMGC